MTSHCSPRVAIIGGGGTGIAILYDLARQNIHADLYERGELTSGTTGRHHGQLHSGARYAANDSNTGAECYRESVILRRIASKSIEYNMGLFIAVSREDEAYHPQFLDACKRAEIPAQEISGERARRMEPGIAPGVEKAIIVPDGTIDSWRLCLQFAAGAVTNGARVHTFSRVIGIETSGGRVSGVRVLNLIDSREHLSPAEIVINATGAWGAQIAGLAGEHVDVTPSPGTMVAVAGRHTNMVISRLHPADDGDIVVPQRSLSIVGSTQAVCDDPDDLPVSSNDVEVLLERGALLVPGIATSKVHAVWAAARPLAGKSVGHLREISRGFMCVDHGRRGGTRGFFSVIGGKATLLRLMAEDVVNLICETANMKRICTTDIDPLPDHTAYFLRNASL